MTTENATVLYGQLAIEWAIPKILDLDTCVRSPTFFLSSASWQLAIFPDRKSEVRKRFLTCLCSMKNNGPDENKIKITIRIKKTDGSVVDDSAIAYSYPRNEGTSIVVCTRFLKGSQLFETNDFVTKDGTLTLVCTACVQDVSQTIEATLSKNLKDLYFSGKWSDVLIKVKNRHFKCHKSMLSSRSSVFNSMLEHEMVESITGEINIPDCEEEDFEEFLIYLYSGEFNSVTSSNALGIYKIADKYDVQSLKEECSKRMAMNLSVEFICDVIQLAELYGECQLLEKAAIFFSHHAEEILATEKWALLMEENTTLAQKMLTRFAKSVKTKPEE